MLMMSFTSWDTSVIELEDWLEMRSSNGIAPGMGTGSLLVLLTRVIVRSDGTEADWTLDEVSMSGKICFNNVMFSLGGLYATFVSRPIIK